MSQSLSRVRAALTAAGITADPVQMPSETRTAEQAAAAAGCALDQIVKSILFRADAADRLFLFLTAGGNRVDPGLAGALAGTALARADADMVRRITGFAIGGVAPLGHLTPLPLWMDLRLMAFETVWAAAGTPRHIFAIAPADLARITSARVAAFCA